MEHTVRAEGAGPSDVNVEPTQTGVETSRRVPAMVVHHVEHDDEPSCSFVRVVTDVQFASSGREGEVGAKEGGMCKKEETGRQEEKKKIESCGSSGVSQSSREVGESLKSPQFCSRHSACSAPTRLQMHDSDGESSDDEGGELVKILPQIPTMREYPSRAYDGAGPSSVCNPTIDEEGQDEARALPEEFYRPHRAERTPLPETFREINSIWGPEAEREQLLKRFMGNPAEYAYNLALKRSEFWRNFANSVVTVNDVSIRQSLMFRKRVEIKPTRAHIPTDPSKHIYFLVRVYRPNKELNIDEMIPANMSSEFLIRGDLSLCALRDNILCLSDFTSYRDESATPFFTNPSRTQIEYPSAYFFINNVFYNDMRAPNSTDLSYEARTVFEQKGLGTYSFQTMERTRLIDLPLTLGRPAIYMHQACCKHLFTFIAVRRATSEDRTVVSGSSMRYLAEKCVVCTMNEAGWIVTGCRRLPYDPALVCLPCYFYYFYGSNAVKKTEFRAFRYRASELEPTNALYFLEDFESSSESSFAEEAPPPAPLSRIASVFSSLSSLSDIEDDVSKGIIDFIDNVLASREDLSSDEPSAPNSDQLNKTVRARVLDYFFDQCAYGNETDTDSAGDDLNDIYAGNGPNRVEGVLNRVVGEINPVDRDMHDVNHEVNGIYGHAHGGDGQMNDVDGHANDRDDRVNDVDRHANGDDGHANDEGGRANGEGDRANGDGGRANGDGGRANGDGGRANGDRRRENGEGGRANDEGRRVNGEGGRANGEGVRANDDGGRVNGERGRVNGEGGPANGEGRRANDGGGRAHMEGGPANGLVRRALGGDRDANAADREGNAIDREVNGGAGYVNGIYVEDNVVDEDVNGIDGDVNEVNEMDVGNDAEQDVDEADDVEMENENIQVRGQIRINGYGGNAFNIDFDGADISGWHIDEVDIDGRQSDGGDGDDRLDDNRRHNDRDYEDWSGHGFNDRGWTEYGWNDRGWNFDDESVDGDGMEGISGNGDDGDDDDDDDDDNDDDNDGEEDDDDEEDEDNGDEDDEDPHEGTVERMIEDVNSYTDDDSDREGGDVWIFNTLMSENAARVNGFADSDTEDYSTDSDVYYI